jgi:hypothetical protein
VAVAGVVVAGVAVAGVVVADVPLPVVGSVLGASCTVVVVFGAKQVGAAGEVDDDPLLGEPEPSVGVGQAAKVTPAGR